MATKVKTVTPEELAKELEVSGKQIRAWLRANFPRSKEQKNTSWHLSPAMAKKVREAFSSK